ncbi:hypothetical protein MC885_006496 [Smutsia gigantea]|nr:hypothetical protein MC885_006496 [Smutsia gigantea]
MQLLPSLDSQPSHSSLSRVSTPHFPRPTRPGGWRLALLSPSSHLCSPSSQLSCCSAFFTLFPYSLTLSSCSVSPSSSATPRRQTSHQPHLVPLLCAVGLQDLILLQRRERLEPTCQPSRRTPIIKNMMEVLLVGTSMGRVGTMGPFLPMPPSKQRLNPFVVTAPSLGAYRDSSLWACPMPSSLCHQRGPKQAPEELGWQRDPSSVPSIVFPCHLESPLVCPFPALCQPLPIQGAQSIQSTNDQVRASCLLSLWRESCPSTCLGPSDLGPQHHGPWKPGASVTPRG